MFSKKIYIKFLISFFLYFFTIFSTISIAKDQNFFNEAKELFDKKKFEESKFLFQRNIIYNPKHAKSYLYLAKIFKEEEDKYKIEKNLNVTLLLEPKNEEAMYMLIDMELKRSNFSKVRELQEDFKIICSKFCNKMPSINSRLKEFEKKDAS